MGEKMEDGTIRLFDKEEVEERERQTFFGRLFGTEKEVISWLKK